MFGVTSTINKIEAKVDEIWALDFTCPYFPKNEDLFTFTPEMKQWAATVEEIREHPETSDDVYELCDELLDLYEELKRELSVYCSVD